MWLTARSLARSSSSEPATPYAALRAVPASIHPTLTMRPSSVTTPLRSSKQLRSARCLSMARIASTRGGGRVVLSPSSYVADGAVFGAEQLERTCNAVRRLEGRPGLDPPDFDDAPVVCDNSLAILEAVAVREMLEHGAHCFDKGRGTGSIVTQLVCG